MKPPHSPLAIPGQGQSSPHCAARGSRESVDEWHVAKLLRTWIAGFLFAGASIALGGELRVGVAAVHFTPPPGIGLAGYYFERGAQRTNDPLFAKAIVLEKDGAQAALT